MKVTEKLPDYVTRQKVIDWIDSTSFYEGIHLVTQFCVAAEKHCNWVLFYSFCYAKTNGFRHPCWDNWDAANFGEKYASSEDGIRDALTVFLAFDDTSLIDVETEMLRVYNDILQFAQGVIYKPVPPIPEPKKEEPQKPIPEPSDPNKEEPIPTQPTPPEKGANWLKWIALIVPAIAGVAALFLPGWAKTLLDLIVALFSNIAQ